MCHRDNGAVHAVPGSSRKERQSGESSSTSMSGMLLCCRNCCQAAWAKLLLSAHQACEELKLPAVIGALFSLCAQCFLWTSKLGMLQPSDLIAQPS